MVLLKCRRCQRVWDYKGKNIYYAVCSGCRGIVTIKNNTVLEVEQ